METETDHKELRNILNKQNELIEANNKLLHKIHRYEMISFWSKLLWFIALIGVPIILYFYFLEPYASSFLETLKNLNGTLHTVPGWEKFLEIYNLENPNGNQ